MATKLKIEVRGGHDYPMYYGGPCINVKAHLPMGLVQVVMNRFSCSRELAEQALEFYEEGARELFWDNAKEQLPEVMRRPGVEIYSGGRSGGWLCVTGLPHPRDDDWDDDLDKAWQDAEEWVKAEIESLLDEEVVLSDIEANRWAEEGAEKYNYIDTEDGSVQCVMDVKKRKAMWENSRTDVLELLRGVANDSGNRYQDSAAAMLKKLDI